MKRVGCWNKKKQEENVTLCERNLTKLIKMKKKQIQEKEEKRKNKKSYKVQKVTSIVLKNQGKEKKG